MYALRNLQRRTATLLSPTLVLGIPPNGTSPATIKSLHTVTLLSKERISLLITTLDVFLASLTSHGVVPGARILLNIVLIFREIGPQKVNI